MSDVIWAAVIAVLGSGIAGLIAYLGSKFSAQETTRREHARLGAEHKESDRQVRREAYRNLLNAIEHVDTLVSDYRARPPTLEDWQWWLQTFRRAQVDARLVESTAVAHARRRVGDLFDELTPSVEARLRSGEPLEDALGYPLVEMRPRLAEAGRALGDAVRADLAFASEADARRLGPPESTTAAA